MTFWVVERAEWVGGGRRRRDRAGRPRRRQVVVRFTDAELERVDESAALAGLAVGAWIGATAVEVARSGGSAVGLPDLLRLHADVLLIERASVEAGGGQADVLVMLERLDAAVDAVVTDVGQARS